MILTRYQSLELGDSNKEDKGPVHHNYGFKINIPQALLLSLLFTFLLCFAGYVSYMLADSSKGCLGPPYLYISYHGGNNILKYTRDGCPLSPNVLWYGSAAGKAVGSVRSMVIHPYGAIKNALFIANAGENEDDRGRVLVFDNCATVNGMRNYMKTLVTVDSTPGAQHTYSMTFDAQQNLYASFQHTDAILRFSNTTFKPMTPVKPTWISDLYSKDDDYEPTPPPPSSNSSSRGFRNYTTEANFFRGTFVQFGYPGLHDEWTRGLRAIAWVQPSEQLWIANEDLHRIIIVDKNGQLVIRIKIKNPIGLLFNRERNMVFIGAKKVYIYIYIHIYKF
mmetsp:Transcript_35424/g.33616  ORF Transcript_35424/g.33616 Transcript_35424/m.33616 type:complete len:335 (-) Transcript_35424:388-1392(-)